MERTPRSRRYVSRALLLLLRPLLRYDYARSAYVLRIVGERFGPVLRQNRRRRQHAFKGSDRRGRTLDRAGASSLTRTV
jgi:hypothetical protein